MNDWYNIGEIGDDVYMIIETGHVQSFLINGNKKSILIDTGAGLADFKSAVTPYAKHDITVLNTHWHFDHIGGNHQFANIGISSVEKELAKKNFPNEALQSYVENYAANAPFPDEFKSDTYYVRGSKVTFIIDDGDTFDLGSTQIEAIATPGHTHGSMSFLESRTGILFCGDLLDKGAIWIQFAESSLDEYIASLETLNKRIGDIKTIYPSHYEAPIPVDNIERAYHALMKIKAGDQSFTEETMEGMPILNYDVDSVQVLLRKPGTEGIDMRKMVE